MKKKYLVEIGVFEREFKYFKNSFEMKRFCKLTNILFDLEEDVIECWQVRKRYLQDFLKNGKSISIDIEAIEKEFNLNFK